MMERQTEEFFELPVSLRIRSPKARVFEEWVRPRDPKPWLCDSLEGRYEAGQSVYWCFGSDRQELRIQAVKAGESVEFSWRAYKDQPETFVRISFEEVGDETGVRVHESKWELTTDNVKIALDHACGWENVLCRLKAWLEAGVSLR